MKAAVNLLWVLLGILGAVALAHVMGAMNPNEKVNGLWSVVAAACIYVLAYRFSGEWESYRANASGSSLARCETSQYNGH